MKSAAMKSGEQNHLHQLLTNGIRELSLTLSAEQCEKLLAYLSLLQKWNSVYNLTAVRDPEQMVKQHLLDCLAVLPAFQGVNTVLDVGSGGGLPGIVLAIAFPDMQLSLIDTVQKKTAFLTQVKVELGLENVTVLTGRVERLGKAEKEAEKFDVITSRAFSDLKEFIQLTRHLLKKDGHYIAMKGAVPEAEIASLPDEWKVNKVWPLKVPGMQAERHLILMDRSSK